MAEVTTLSPSERLALALTLQALELARQNASDFAALDLALAPILTKIATLAYGKHNTAKINRFLHLIVSVKEALHNPDRQ